MASNEIAKERQETFHDFENSKYADGSYFDKYVTKDWGPQSDVVKGLLKVFLSLELKIGRSWKKM